MLNIHPTATISPLADIERSVRGTEITISANSTIDSFVKIKPAGGSGSLIIGEYTTINSGCVLYTGNGLTIGDCCAIAANVVFAPTNHEYRNPDKHIIEQGFMESRGGIIVEDDVWIGAGAVLLDGAHIGKGSVIAALSVVRGHIPNYSVVAGNPGKVIKKRDGS